MVPTLIFFHFSISHMLSNQTNFDSWSHLTIDHTLKIEQVPKYTIIQQIHMVVVRAPDN